MTGEKFDFYSKVVIKSYNLDNQIRYQLKMLDSLDAYTRKHSENVANITCRLCEYLKMDKGFTVYTTTCAFIHDIGKLFIPPQILQKPARLTDEEYEVIKTHTTIGYKMCIEDPKLRPYAAGPLYHHEALNGKGYPSGLKGKDIPYEAQIIRVADEFEAITSKRQYKTHVGISDTLKLVARNSDPDQEPRFWGLKLLTDEARLGRIDKKIVKALFKVVVDDTEYEIVSREEYLKFLKDEIKRLEEAHEFYEKMMGAGTESKREYYKQGVEMYLKTHEVAEKCPEILDEFKEAYRLRKDHVKRLYDEVSVIKGIVI